MWPRVSGLLASPRLQLGLALLACAVGFGLGVRWQRGADAIEQQAALQRLARQRGEAEDAARQRDAANEERIGSLRRTAETRTRKARQNATLPDRRLPLPDGLLDELNAAARSP